MSNAATETLSVVIEREVAFPPEKIWRALTQPHLIEEWLMKNDFKPSVGHRFNLRGDWGGVRRPRPWLRSETAEAARPSAMPGAPRAARARCACGA